MNEMAQPVEDTLALAMIEDIGLDYNALARLQFQVNHFVARWYPFVNAISYRRLMEIYADEGRVAWACNIRVIGRQEEIAMMRMWAGKQLHDDNLVGSSIAFREL